MCWPGSANNRFQHFQAPQRLALWRLAQSRPSSWFGTMWIFFLGKCQYILGEWHQCWPDGEDDLHDLAQHQAGESLACLVGLTWPGARSFVVIFDIFNCLLWLSREPWWALLHSWGQWGRWGCRWWQGWPGCPGWLPWTTRSRWTPGTRSSGRWRGPPFLRSSLSVREKPSICTSCLEGKLCQADRGNLVQDRKQKGWKVYCLDL